MSDTVVHTLPLSELPRGTEGRVVGVDGASPVSRRLGAIGFLPGASVRALGRLPLGDPLVVALDGARVALRRDEAALVRVVRDEETSG